MADLKSNPMFSTIYGFLFAMVGIGLSIIARENPVFVASITASFLLIGPFLAIGLYAISRLTEKKRSIFEPVCELNKS